MYSGKTIDSRSGLPKDIDYELLRFQTHTGRAFLLSNRGFEKKYGYRHGVETPVGDIEENLWCALMKELIEKNNDTALYAALLDWFGDCPVAGRTKKEREFYVLQCFSNQLFDNEEWVDYVPFNQKYAAFMERVSEGAEQIHTATLTPYEIITPIFKRDFRAEERKAIDVTWNAQEDFTGGENALVVIDGSGSMYGGADPIPATVALSLGIYYAERNTGAFHNHFITFSENPRLVEIKGTDIFEKVRYCHQFNEVANTNIQRVFELVLNAAVKNRVPQEEMPSKIFIISDMEFDYCAEDCSLSNFEYAKKLFNEQGYQLPDLVFWNVDSRNRQQPVEINDQGVALVSGCNSRIFSMLKSGILSPYAVMMEVLGSERYAPIVA